MDWKCSLGEISKKCGILVHKPRG